MSDVEEQKIQQLRPTKNGGEKPPPEDPELASKVAKVRELFAANPGVSFQVLPSTEYESMRIRLEKASVVLAAIHMQTEGWKCR